ncbi:MAG: cell division protein FtsH, partial [Leptospiraceae bacterium]|nr:cell division protein FtsH [Leptospiraceae bacterium]
TIIPRGQALGLTHQLPEEDKHIQPGKYWEDRICVLMGGYLAEETVYHDTATGASNDIQVASNIARRMVCEWGMSKKLGTVNYSSDHSNVFIGRELSSGKNFSEETAHIIDEEVRRIVTEQLERGRRLIQENRSKLDSIARALLVYESISGDQLRDILSGKELNLPESENGSEAVARPDVGPTPLDTNNPLTESNH